ncbi:MAG: tetratricopeptide repeat protein [Rhodobacteraceae bacterium]|nr:tetratricopeptide repeat protein [Paracoccaceae bacterium]
MDPAEDVASLQVAKTFKWFEIARQEQRRGSLSRALAASKRAEAAARRSGDEENVSATLIMTGEILMRQGRLPEARRSYREALAIHERLARKHPGTSASSHAVSVLREKFGELAIAEGNPAKALEDFQASLDIRTRLVEADPANNQWSRDLSVAHEKIGDVLMDQGHLADALECFRASVTIGQRLIKIDPDNAEWSRDLAISWGKGRHGARRAGQPSRGARVLSGGASEA